MILDENVESHFELTDAAFDILADTARVYHVYYTENDDLQKVVTQVAKRLAHEVKLGAEELDYVRIIIVRALKAPDYYYPGKYCALGFSCVLEGKILQVGASKHIGRKYAIEIIVEDLDNLNYYRDNIQEFSYLPREKVRGRFFSRRRMNSPLLSVRHLRRNGNRYKQAVRFSPGKRLVERQSLFGSKETALIGIVPAWSIIYFPYPEVYGGSVCEASKERFALVLPADTAIEGVNVDGVGLVQSDGKYVYIEKGTTKENGRDAIKLPGCMIQKRVAGCHYASATYLRASRICAVPVTTSVRVVGEVSSVQTQKREDIIKSIEQYCGKREVITYSRNCEELQVRVVDCKGLSTSESLQYHNKVLYEGVLSSNYVLVIVVEGLGVAV